MNHQVLENIDREGSPVNLQIVAQRAQVSRSWRYTRPDLCAGYRGLRDSRHGSVDAPPPALQHSTDASLLRRLEIAKARVRDLTTENQPDHALRRLRASMPER